MISNFNIQKIFIRIIAIIQFIGSLLGFALFFIFTIPIIIEQNLTFNDILTLLSILILYCIGIIAGYKLYKLEYTGFILSIFIQFVQILKLNLMWIDHHFFIGLSFYVMFKYPFDISYYYGIGTSIELLNFNPEFTLIGINIIPILLIIFLFKVFKTFEKPSFLTDAGIIMRRMIAIFIDYALVFGFHYTYIKFFGQKTEYGGYIIYGVEHIILIFLAWIIYFPLVESIFGYTLGKGLFDLSVIGKNNQKVTFGNSFKRHLADIIDFFTYGSIAILNIAFSKSHKRIGDKWAETFVIYKKNV